MGKVLLVMGHRNRDGGNQDEAARTPLIVEAAARELRRAGHEVHVLQEEDNIDGDPRFTHGSLGVVADRCRELIQRHGIQVMIDAHFQSSDTPTTGCFFVFPDGNTLDPRPPGNDGKDANSLDLKFGRRLAAEVSRQTNIRLLPIAEPGFPGGMSETQTFVGLGGSRLGMFNRTVAVREQCVRIIMEHGDIRADAGVINSPGYFDRVAQAYVRAIDEFWPVAPVSEEFFAFREPHTFTAHAGALGRRRASTTSEVVREYDGGEQVRCIGYFEAQEIAGDTRWLRAGGEDAPRIHRSGVVEEIPPGDRAEPTPGLAILVADGVATEEELARSELVGNPTPEANGAATATIGCEMTMTIEAPVASVG